MDTNHVCAAPPRCFPSPHSFGTTAGPRFLTVPEAFAHHASSTPFAIAARALYSSSEKPAEITYRGLSNRSSRLASQLRHMGVRPGSKVPLIAKRGIDMLVGILAILSCGAQYVPLDGGVVPDSTLRFVVAQAGGKTCTVVVLRSTSHRVDPETVANVVCIDEASSHVMDDEDKSLPLENYATPKSGCYIIYTSGRCSFIMFYDLGRLLTLNVKAQLGLQRASM